MDGPPSPAQKSRESYLELFLSQAVPAWLSPLINLFSQTLLELSMNMNVCEQNTINWFYFIPSDYYCDVINDVQIWHQNKIVKILVFLYTIL